MSEEPPKQIFKYFPMSNCLGNYCEAHTDCTQPPPFPPERKVCVEWLICITPCSFILDLITLIPRQLYYNYCSDKNNSNSIQEFRDEKGVNVLNV